MLRIRATLDRTTTAAAATAGAFQVISLQNNDGAELTGCIDQRRRFDSIEELQKALSDLFLEEVFVQESKRDWQSGARLNAPQPTTDEWQ